jgi:hypothetical protein
MVGPLPQRLHEVPAVVIPEVLKLGSEKLAEFNSKIFMVLVTITDSMMRSAAD